eukprot:5217785-Amphidinium_carterae.1
MVSSTTGASQNLGQKGRATHSLVFNEADARLVGCVFAYCAVTESFADEDAQHSCRKVVADLCRFVQQASAKASSLERCSLKVSLRVFAPKRSSK